MKNSVLLHKILIHSIFFLIICSSQITIAQGCVAVRQMAELTVNSSNRYNLNKGDLQIGTNYRYFHSFRHFIGKEEQPQRQTTGGGRGADGIERGNAVNIYSHALDLNFSYGLTHRFQLNASLPYVNNERSQVLRQTKPIKDTIRYSVFAKGLGDVRLTINYWLFDPVTYQKGNIMLGVGVKLNNGRYNVKNDAPQADGTIANVVMDQAIQPGDGGIGYILDFQSFKQLNEFFYGFANAFYLFSPRESNGAFRSDPRPGLEGYEIYASPDQYFARVGLMATINKSKSLNVSLASRIEGIPAYDAFGGQVAYRRPGYVIAAEYGLSYRFKNHGFSLFIPYNVVKNRIQSAADIASENLQNAAISDPKNYVHVQGDAAFADYSINIGYTYRISTFSKKK